MPSVKSPRARACTGRNGIPTETIPNRIFVGGFSPKVTEQRLREIFDKYGTITDVNILRCRNNNTGRGCGFVTFATVEEARRARLSTQSYELDGRRLNVCLALKRVWESENDMTNYVPNQSENSQDYMWPNGTLDNMWTHPMPMQVYALPDGTHVFMPLCYESIMSLYSNVYCVERMPPNTCPIQFLTAESSKHELSTQCSELEQGADECDSVQEYENE